MRRINSMRIVHGNPWEPEFEGLFLEQDGVVQFCFHEENSVFAQRQDGSRDILYTPPEGRLELPGRWADVRPGEPPVIRSWQPDPSEEYHFGNYSVTHQGEWNYVCRHNGEEQWSFRAYAWRYTEICQYGGRVFFGTAGQGGYFYLLDLKTGALVLKLKTGGTARWVQREERLYLLQQEKKACLISIDLKEGIVLERLELPGKVSSHSALSLIGGTIHAISFEYGKGRLQQALWNCIEIE